METIDRSHMIATLGGGCFWCLEAVYLRVEGVTKVISGYAGGSANDASYEMVCSGSTGHAEVVQITFDVRIIKFTQLLDLFWRIHDPTTLNRQGYDVGTHYRSLILSTDDRQQHKAEVSRNQAQKLFLRPIVTEILPLKEFYPAEDNHQNYYNRNVDVPYCQMIITPKLKALSDSDQMI